MFGRSGPSPPPGQPELVISSADSRRILARINLQRAASPDNIPGHVLKVCAIKLADMLTDIFNISLCQATVPRCLKTSILMPVVSRLNDYRPVTLTPIVMKCFERLIK